MTLKYKVGSKAEVPAGMEGNYVEREGSLVLDVEGAVEKCYLDEARKAKADLAREFEAHRQRFEGIDPDEVRKLTEEKRRLEEEQQLKAGDIEKVIEARVRAVKGDLDRKLAGVSAERDALMGRLMAFHIDQAVVSEASKRGLRASAILDITARARSTFRLGNGGPQAFEADGQTPRVGKDGVTPLSVAEWVDTQVSEAPHLFEGNVGSGVPGNGSIGGGGGSRSVKNPYRKETWNLTEQMKLERKDPALAERLKAAA
jgi:hypothetical protein